MHEIEWRLASLLHAPSLAWELHAARCPLWSAADPTDGVVMSSDSDASSKEDGAAGAQGGAPRADEWAVVERPGVPPPAAQPEDIDLWYRLNRTMR